MRADLFVGITSWNSGRFLGPCLQALRKTTADVRTRVVVVDNASSDDSARIARAEGAEVRVRRSSQADALNELVSLSRSPYTLLLHADIILLSPQWFDLCMGKLQGTCVLVAPEDIGCGPYTRPFGIGKPESSFLFFRTQALHRLAQRHSERKWGIPLRRRRVDFYGPHITHRLPEHLSTLDMTWMKMSVHVSDTGDPPKYGPYKGNVIWNDELSRLRYGLGNFYSLDGMITHYHNWYERVPEGHPGEDENESVAGKERGFPLGYIRAYTKTFLADYAAGAVVIPEAKPSGRIPVAL